MSRGRARAKKPGSRPLIVTNVGDAIRAQEERGDVTRRIEGLENIVLARGRGEGRPCGLGKSTAQYLRVDATVALPNWYINI
jgi:hypothetical protein